MTTEKLELLIVEDDIILNTQMKTLIEDSDDMYLIAITNDSNKAVEHIKDSMPDVVILDLELHEGNGSGLNVLHDMRLLSLPKKPYVLVTTNNSSTITQKAVRSLGADYIMSKHQKGYSPENVLDFLRIMRATIKSTPINFSTYNTSKTSEQYSKRIYQRIMTELNHVGINPKSIGYAYLADAIYLMYKQPVQNICTILADKYSKSESSVERAMQNAINRAWKTYDIEDLLLYYKAKISSIKGSPTLTEFICYYSNLLKNEY